MDMIDKDDIDNDAAGLPAVARGLHRRAVLIAAAATAAATAAGVSAAAAEPVPAASFGAPVVELHVPAGVLTLEQKAEMIKGMTDVVMNAIKLPPDPHRFAFVQILETTEGGFGVNGQPFVPRAK
jgi:phenylpyruvate tautomerase PptA (4-oxalocrotonate tautomerase family)